jgi:hypothetical protein
MKFGLTLTFFLAGLWPHFELLAAARSRGQKTSSERWSQIRIVTQAQVPHRLKLSGIQVSSNQFLALLPTEVSFQDVIFSSSLCLESTRCLPLRAVQVDLKNRWIWLESSQKIAGALSTRYKPSKSRSPAASVVGGNSRAMAKLVEGEIQNWSQQFYRASLKEKQNISLGGASFTPRLKQLSCAPSTGVIGDEQIQKMIYAGDSMECQTEKSPAVLTSFDYGFKTKFGYLDIWSNRVLTDAQRGKMLEELGRSEMADLKKQSAHIAQSTHIVCDSSYLRDESVEVQFCTRTIRSMPGLQDSVFILGRNRNQRFYYNVIRLSGFNQELTKRFADNFITVFAGQP